jgi:hypothetical protein
VTASTNRRLIDLDKVVAQSLARTEAQIVAAHKVPSYISLPEPEHKLTCTRCRRYLPAEAVLDGYLDAGDLTRAVASMTSDLTKHEETRRLFADTVMPHVLLDDADKVREWIEGFN